MTTTLYICDRCGKELSMFDYESMTVACRIQEDVAKFDLCDNCKRKMWLWLYNISECDYDKVTDTTWDHIHEFIKERLIGTNNKDGL